MISQLLKPEPELTCKHEHIVRDEFSRLPGVSRQMPGDCFCLDCHEPIAANWNGGKPVEVSDE